MPRVARVRKSLSLRLQPYSGEALATVTDYLNSLEKTEATKKVGEILVMALLPYAKSSSGKVTPEHLRSTFLASRDLMEKHFGMMVLSLELEESLYAAVAPQNLYKGNGANGSTPPAVSESGSEPSDNSLISGKATATEITTVWG